MDKIFGYIKKFLKNRNFKYGSNSIILIAAVVAIAVVLNMLVGMVDVKFDLTPEKLYSLGDVSKDILNGLDKEIVIYGLFDDGQAGASDYKEVVEILDKYDQYEYVNVEYIDPDKNPGIIKEIDPDTIMDLEKTDLVVVCGDKKKKLERYDLFQMSEFDYQTFQQYVIGSTAEQGITGAVKYVSADVTPTIYFLQGHEENSIDDDYGRITTALTQNNYDVKTLNLLSEEKVPNDCTVLVVASPKKDLSVDEKNRLEDYMESGGKAMFMFDSLSDDPSFERFDELLLKYNLALGHDKVKENDSSRYVPSRQYHIAPYVQSNSINSKIGTALMVMPDSRSIKILKNVKEWIVTTSLLKTSDAAVGEQISGGEDTQGPLDIAVAVEYTGGMNPERIVVTGNSIFINDDVMDYYGTNGFYFFINWLFWLEDRQDEAVVAPKAYENPTININQMQTNVMGVVVVIVLPLLILLAGLFVYLRRRHL